MKGLLKATLALGALLCASVAQAQNYPSAPVHIIVPYTAGGGTDAIARGLAQHLSELWQQRVVVENRPAPAQSSAPRRRRDRRPATRCCSPSRRPSSSTRTSIQVAAVRSDHRLHADHGGVSRCRPSSR